MTDLRTRLEDMRDFCRGATGGPRPHPESVARLCDDILKREEERAMIVADIRDKAETLRPVSGAAINAGRVMNELINIADELDGNPK